MPVAASPPAAVMAVLVIGGVVTGVRNDQHLYAPAGTQRGADIAAAERAASRSQRPTDILLGDDPTRIGPPTDPLSPTLLEWWDASASVQLHVGSTSLHVAPLDTKFRCESRRLVLPADGMVMPCGRTVVVEVGRGTSYPIGPAEQCAKILPWSMTVSSP